MRKFALLGIFAPVVLGCVGLVTSSAKAVVYYGNGGTSFGGNVGNGSLTVTDNGSGTLTFSFQSSTNSLNGNDFVLYLSTGTTGLSNTGTLADNGDPGREAISGYNSATNTNGDGLSRSLVTFPTGFLANFAISFEDNYVGLFSLLNETTPPSLNYVDGQSQSSEPDTVSLSLAELGLTQGQSFLLDGTLISGSAYRSNETIGGSSSADGTGSTQIGFNGGLTFTGDDAFSTVAAVPEPSSLALVGLAGGGLGVARRRRRATTVGLC